MLFRGLTAVAVCVKPYLKEQQEHYTDGLGERNEVWGCGQSRPSSEVQLSSLKNGELGSHLGFSSLTSWSLRRASVLTRGGMLSEA